MARLAILGASGHGKVVADTAMQAGWNGTGFFDDAWPALRECGGHPVLGRTDAPVVLSDYDGVIVAIGNNRVRLEKTQALLSAGAPLVTLIHPAATIASNVSIDAGSVVFAGAVVQPGSSLGIASIVNSGATVDHDCLLEAGVHVCPGAHLAGAVRVGECGWIGIGAVTVQCVRLGRDARVGAGAAVIDDVPDAATVVGVPARRLISEPEGPHDG